MFSGVCVTCLSMNAIGNSECRGVLLRCSLSVVTKFKPLTTALLLTSDRNSYLVPELRNLPWRAMEAVANEL